MAKRTKTSTTRKAVKRKPKVVGKGSMKVVWPKSWAKSWAEHQTKLATAKLDKTAQELRAVGPLTLIDEVTR
jgi:hypothetical protein